MKRNLSPRTREGALPDPKRSRSLDSLDDLEDELDDDFDQSTLFGGRALSMPAALGLVPTQPSLDLSAPVDVGASLETTSQPIEEETVEEQPVEEEPVEFWHAYDDLPTFALPQPSDPVRGAPTPVHPLLQPKRELTAIDATDTSDYDAARTWLRDDFGGLTTSGPNTTPTRQRVDLQQYGKPSEVPGKITEKTGVAIKGANQSGKYPDVGEDYALPKGANYQGQYSSRLLTYLSTVSRSALELEGLPPVEVQYGHAFNDEGAYQLFASTNNLATQERLAQLLADPSAMVEKVGLATPEQYRGGWEPKPTDSDMPQSEVDDRAKHAMKLAMFPELQQRRAEAIPDDAEDRDARLQDLELANQAFDAFARSDVTVAMSPSNVTERKKKDDAFFASASTRLDKAQKAIGTKQATWNTKTVPKYAQDLETWQSNGAEKDKKPDAPQRPDTKLGDTRHAEQNVATAMHDTNVERSESGQSPFTHADIQGTMIRCTGCSAELGANLVDDDDVELTGRIFAAQASLDRFCADCLLKRDGTRQSVTSTNAVQVPMSPGSPVPSVWDDEASEDPLLDALTTDPSVSSQPDAFV